MNPYGYPMYGAPTTTTTTTYTTAPAPMMPPPGVSYVSIPQSYTRVMYSYSYPYDRYSPFMIPFGVSPQVAEVMMQASAVFRTFDLNYSGTLDYNEWRLAMHQLGYWMNDFDAIRLFQMIDTDRSGQISEREFVEYWVWSRGLAAPVMAPPMMTTIQMAAPFY